MADKKTKQEQAAQPVNDAPMFPDVETKQALTGEVLSAASEKTAFVRSPLGLNLREGPARSYGVRAVLPDGCPLTLPALPEGADVPGWAFVRVAEGLPECGWVDTEFVGA